MFAVSNAIATSEIWEFQKSGASIYPKQWGSNHVDTQAMDTHNLQKQPCGTIMLIIANSSFDTHLLKDPEARGDEQPDPDGTSPPTSISSQSLA